MEDNDPTKWTPTRPRNPDMPGRRQQHQLFGVVICISIALCNEVAEDKWVWSKERKSDLESETARITVAKPILSDSASEPSRKIDEQISRLFDDNDDYRKARYEVQETIDYVNGRPISQSRPKPFSIRPVQPPSNRPPYIFNEQKPQQGPFPDRLPYTERRPLIPDRPIPLSDNNRYPLPPPLPDRYPPPPSLPPQRPSGPPNEFVSPLPQGNSIAPVRRQPPTPAVGILTGPVPSWEKPSLHKNGDPTNFEHCKCSFSFNCKSPGIQFGNCDQGKTYCCYNEFNANKENGVQPNAFGSSNIERFDRVPPLLIGTGGSNGPVYHREGYRVPYIPSYEEINSNLNQEEIDDRKPYPLIPQKPVLPPYMGFHNDYRSSK